MRPTDACLAKRLLEIKVYVLIILDLVFSIGILKMAIGQGRNEFVQRSKGQNICHKAAYIDRARLEFEGTKFQDRKTYDYSSREAPLANRIMLPDGVDEKFKDPKILWNAAEKIELRRDSQVGMELVIALPDDKVITEKDRIELTERFAQQFVDKGLAAHYAIHRPDDPKHRLDNKPDHNWHAHILVPTRTFSKDGHSLHPLKDRTMQQELATTRWGDKWTEIQNNYFKELGLDLRVDPKALVREEHLGAIRLRGNCLEMLERNEELKTLNAIEASNPIKILNAIENSKSVWEAQDVDRFMAKHTPMEKLAEVRDQFWRLEDIVKLQVKVPGKSQFAAAQLQDTDKFTTIKVIEEEKQIIRRCDHINDIDHIKLKDNHLEKFSGSFNGEQYQAFRTLSGRSGIAVLEGYAGTGKSYVLAALKDAYEAKDIKVRGFGPDNATSNLLKDKGFNSENVPRFLHAAHHGHRDIGKKELWIVDEAGKLGNQSLNELCRLAYENKARLILAGDSGQMPSVDRGGIFQVLAGRYKSAELQNIQRQNTDEHRSIAQSFAEGDIEKAVSALHSEKCLNFSRDKGDSMEKLIVDWSFQHYKDESKKLESSLILATSNREVTALNQAAHDVRMAKGELKEQELSCNTIFGEVRVSEGDLIEFRKNTRELGVTNGLRGELIKATEDRFTVQLESEGKKTKIVSFDPKEYGSWQLGYATTTYRSQGRTVDDTYVLHSAQNGKQSAYVAMSRHQENVSCYISKDECRNYSEFVNQLSKDNSKESTLNYQNAHDTKQAYDKETFERSISQDKDYGGKWSKLKAYGREFKSNINEVMDHHRETKADKRDSNDFYERGDTNTKPEGIEYGVSKLEDVKLNAIEVQALRPIELVNEELRIQEAVLDRQEMQLNKLAVYHEECLKYGKSPIEGIENIFSAEHERDIVVLCRSQKEADFASENFQQEGSVFISLGGENINDRELSIEDSLHFERELENDVDLSILEGRKVLVWGDELERISTLEKFQGDYVNMHVREIDFDFVLDDPADFREADAEVVSGSWLEVEEQEQKLDVELGIEKEQENQRGFELSL
jgi:Ti-type conjugative transfer relaxase TraA